MTAHGRSHLWSQHLGGWSRKITASLRPHKYIKSHWLYLVSSVHVWAKDHIYWTMGSISWASFLKKKNCLSLPNSCLLLIASDSLLIGKLHLFAFLCIHFFTFSFRLSSVALHATHIYNSRLGIFRCFLFYGISSIYCFIIGTTLFCLFKFFSLIENRLFSYNIFWLKGLASKQ